MPTDLTEIGDRHLALFGHLFGHDADLLRELRDFVRHDAESGAGFSRSSRPNLCVDRENPGPRADLLDPIDR